MIPLSEDDPEVIPAGGCPNHNGSMVLNALGCPNTIQITRRDGASNFGQTVAKRFFDLDGFEMDYPERLVSQTGLAEDMNSDWSRLYYLRNPKSSFNQALYVSDGVWCTDWDRYRPEKNHLKELVEDAYHAEFYIPDMPLRRPNHESVNDLSQKGIDLAGEGYDRVISNDARKVKDQDGEGHSEHAGCIPLVDTY